MAATKKGGRTLVVGLGKTGLSCARWLTAQGERVAVIDSREHPPGLDALRAEMPDVAVFLGGFEARAFEQADRLVVSPGVSLQTPPISAALVRGVEVVGDIDLFAAATDRPVVAITGSNGKSTVTTLMGVMAEQAGVNVAVGGNLGTPALDLLADKSTELFVLELSSFQLETTRRLKPVAAVVLNVSEDHMDRYPDLASYAAAKQGIFNGDGAMVINRDDAVVAAMADSKRRVVGFTLERPAAGDFGIVEHNGAEWLAQGDRPLMATAELLIPGRHNLANALAALALAEAIDLPMEARLRSLRGFRGLPHRTEWVADIDGVSWYNDSKATNVGAAIAALNGMGGPLVLIAGGDGKGADFSPMREPVAANCRAVVLIGRDAPILEQALAGSASLVRAKDMADAVDRCSQLARQGDKVLLSPACA
ncbi:MAG: UDP-N-acetylmuramoyl-L-alanine--D-glutamate ligase, partial [Chromatiales bacterium]|nr:UDP-N-acetylmuramoyl-L-alanine--D-glutamate ligase [Chromatiales bacterium]